MASDVKCVVSVFICNEGETLIKYFDFLTFDYFNIYLNNKSVLYLAILQSQSQSQNIVLKSHPHYL